MINCLLAGNICSGRIVEADVCDFIGCTFAGNDVAQWPVLIQAKPGTRLINCIEWNNSSSVLPTGVVASYCCSQSGWPGVGNFSIDPLFVDPNGGDFRLSPGSPCIDAGDTSALPPDTYDLDGDLNTTEPLPIDFGHLARRVDDPDTPDTGIGPAPVVDIGAHEFQGCVGDLTGDKQVNQDDLAILLAAYGKCPGDPGYAPAANLAFRSRRRLHQSVGPGCTASALR